MGRRWLCLVRTDEGTCLERGGEWEFADPGDPDNTDGWCMEAWETAVMRGMQKMKERVLNARRMGIRGSKGPR